MGANCTCIPCAPPVPSQVPIGANILPSFGIRRMAAPRLAGEGRVHFSAPSASPIARGDQGGDRCQGQDECQTRILGSSAQPTLPVPVLQEWSGHEGIRACALGQYRWITSTALLVQSPLPSAHCPSSPAWEPLF